MLCVCVWKSVHLFSDTVLRRRTYDTRAEEGERRGGGGSEEGGLAAVVVAYIQRWCSTYTTNGTNDDHFETQTDRPGLSDSDYRA